MSVYGDVTAAWRAGRAVKRAKPSRPSYTVRAARYLSRKLPTWKKVRTTVLQVAAFAFIDFGIWSIHFVAGLIAVGVSLLVLEALGGDKQ